MGINIKAGQNLDTSLIYTTGYTVEWMYTTYNIKKRDL